MPAFDKVTSDTHFFQALCRDKKPDMEVAYCKGTAAIVHLNDFYRILKPM